MNLRADTVALTLLALTAFMPSGRAAFPSSLASSEYVVRAWGMEDGLPENSATAIVEAQDGYLWFGTFNGLVRFNGDKFKVFNPNNTPQLPSAGIVNLYSDKRHRLWVSTLEGLVVKDGTQWRAFGTNEGWVGNYVRTFAERENGDLLFTTFDGHVLAIELDRLTALPTPPGEPRGYFGAVDESGRWWLVQNRFVGYWNGQRWIQVHDPSPSVGPSLVGCAPARGGGVWVLLEKELFKFREGREVSRLSLPQVKGAIWSLAEDSRTNLWICDNDFGLFQVTPKGDVHQWTTTNGLGSMSARVVFEDREENLWIGSSSGGLRRFKPRRFSEVDAGSVLSGRPTRSVSLARDGGLWMATHGSGLLRHTETGGSSVFSSDQGTRVSYGLSVLEDRGGRLWFGAMEGFWWRTGQEAFQKIPVKLSVGANVRALFEDSKGRVWAGARESVVCDGNRFSPLGPEAGLPPGDIVCFGEDKSGAVWLAGAAGVFRQEKQLFVEVRATGGQPLKGVMCFKADADGSMWMGTRAGSLIRSRNGELRWVNVNQDLQEREVRGLIEDDQGYFWMPSNRGIIRASHKQLNAAADKAVSHLEVQIFDQNDGLSSIECPAGQPICARDASGKIYFATLKGVMAIDPASFLVNAHPPPVKVEQLHYHLAATSRKVKSGWTPGALDEVHLTAPFANPLRLPPGSYGLELEFAALSYSAPEKVRCEWQLGGMDRDWQDSGALRVATFHQLPPGEYVFRVRAANNDGVWNEAGASLAFTVQPFFWQTTWFAVVVALLIMSSGGVAVWWVMRERLRRAQERERLHLALQEILEQRNQLTHLSRVNVLGELVGSIAHELNQPLTAILSNAQAAQRFLSHPQPNLKEIRDILSDVVAEDKRAGEVIRSLRLLLQKGELRHEPLNINEVVQEVLKLMRSDLLNQNCIIQTELAPDLPVLRGDRVQLQQVVLNLVMNGCDAMAGVSRNDRKLAIRTVLQGSDRVQIIVADCGPGIALEKLDQVFEPFYTTKPHGLGLGLAVCRTIVTAHAGKLWATNNPGLGASFHFTLPVNGTGHAAGRLISRQDATAGG